MEKIQLTPKAARGLSALVSDIVTVDTRAKCSDRFFRQHFMLVVNTLRDTGTLKELQAQLLDSQKEESPQDAPEKPPDMLQKKARKGKTDTDEPTAQ